MTEIAPNPARAKASRPAPLDAQAWIAAALLALGQSGIEAVRVEPLAKALKVTKGSFYWHFKDRAALIDAMLDEWAQGRIAAIRSQTADADPSAALRRLADLYTGRTNARGLAIELAIRTLARSGKAAAAAVARVDRERLAHVAALFAGLGWPDNEARARAILFYGFLFGQSLLDRQTARADDNLRAVEAVLAGPPLG